jgi:hypothetical protein
LRRRRRKTPPYLIFETASTKMIHRKQEKCNRYKVPFLIDSRFRTC